MKTTQPNRLRSTKTNQTLHPKIIELLNKRGLDENEIKEFFSWDLKTIHDLTDIIDIEKASSRIIKAIENNEKIAVYGDYDVDGTTSCALLYHFFKYFDLEVELIQPSRFVEGYGIHPPAIEKANENDIKVLITVDCGITNSEAANRAKELGIDLIITDHHTDALDTPPDAFAIVNPNRRDEDSNHPLKSLAGVGVAFSLAWQIKKEWDQNHKPLPSLYELLQFVAIGTICDLAKLTNVNLRLVRHGLKQIPQTRFAGIRAFFTPEELNAPLIPSEKLSFQIGPLINSKGRLDHPEMALKLLIEDDSQKAFEYYSHLETCNNERKFIQAEVVNEAKTQVSNFFDNKTVCLVVYQPHWHEGVIGIVASKLVEEYKVPALVFCDSEEEGVIKASARSAGEFDLFSALKELDQYFVKFGGHKAAAGLSMPKENLKKFRKDFHNKVSEVPAIMRTKELIADIEISLKDINPNLLSNLSLLEPFGMGNPKPIFRSRQLKLASYDILKEKHVRWNFKEVNSDARPQRGISFNWIGKWQAQSPEQLYKDSSTGPTTLEAFYTLGINRFNGNEYIQLMIEKVQQQSH